MPDILIRGMKMPQSCHSCWFFRETVIRISEDEGYNKSYCSRTGNQTFDIVEKFLPDCPLIPIPPHGRLIDADGEIGVNVTMMPSGKCKVDLIAPTIILADPAEEGM